MSDGQQDDAKAVWEEELRRRDWSRVFLKYLQVAARLRAEYQLALEELVSASGIQRDIAEDSLVDDLDWAVESLVERCPDPLLIQATITETDAREMLDGQGAFPETTFELNEEQSAILKKEIEEEEADPESLRSHEELWAEIYAGIEEGRRRVDLGEYEGREQALNAIRNSGFRGLVLDAYWDNPDAYIYFSDRESRQFLATKRRVEGYAGPEDAAARILGARTPGDPVKVLHSEGRRTTIEIINP